MRGAAECWERYWLCTVRAACWRAGGFQGAGLTSSLGEEAASEGVRKGRRNSRGKVLETMVMVWMFVCVLQVCEFCVCVCV